MGDEKDTNSKGKIEIPKIYGLNIFRINAKKCDSKSSWHSTKEIKTLPSLLDYLYIKLFLQFCFFFFNAICLFQASLFLSSLAILSLRGHGKVASMKSVHCSCPYSITKHYPPEGKWTIMERVERGMRCTNTDRDFFTLLFWNKMSLHAYGLQGYMLTFIVNGYVRSNDKAARHWSHYLTDLMEEPLQLSISSLPPPPPPPKPKLNALTA